MFTTPVEVSNILFYFLDSGFPSTESPQATQSPTATQGSTAPQRSTLTQGPTTTQVDPVTTTPEPPLFQNFSGYHIGVGRADCTGQVADINMVSKSWAPQRDCEIKFYYFESCIYS